MISINGVASSGGPLPAPGTAGQALTLGSDLVPAWATAGGTVTAADITDSTATGRSVLTGTAAQGRTALSVYSQTQTDAAIAAAVPRALNNPISVVTSTQSSPLMASGGGEAATRSVETLSGGVPAGATYAVVWIYRVDAGTSGITCTVDRLYVDAGSSWNFALWWRNGSGSTQSADAATIGLKIYWY